MSNALAAITLRGALFTRGGICILPSAIANEGSKPTERP
jgi:hypothetical protein